MATNIKKKEAANAPMARVATLQTDLNRLENVKVCALLSLSLLRCPMDHSHCVLSISKSSKSTSPQIIM